MLKFFFIDHYDSFSFNLIDWLRRDPDVTVERICYDDPGAMARAASESWPLVLSPGPKAPADARATLDLLAAAAGQRPILGVCLGHQMLAHAFGGRVQRSRVPRHGAVRRITADPCCPLFAGMSAPFQAAAYNSLTIDPDALGPDFAITARCEDGEVQGLVWRQGNGYPAYGIQYHPESFLSEGQGAVLDNWLAIAKAYVHCSTQ